MCVRLYLCTHKHTHSVAFTQEDDDIYTQIELERAELRKRGGTTPVTFDSFVAWKERKARERQQVWVCVCVCYACNGRRVWLACDGSRGHIEYIEMRERK